MKRLAFLLILVAGCHTPDDSAPSMKLTYPNTAKVEVVDDYHGGRGTFGRVAASDEDEQERETFHAQE